MCAIGRQMEGAFYSAYTYTACTHRVALSLQPRPDVPARIMREPAYRLHRPAADEEPFKFLDFV